GGPDTQVSRFVAWRFPLLRPAQDFELPELPIRGNLSEGSLLFDELYRFKHAGSSHRNKENRDSGTMRSGHTESSRATIPPDLRTDAAKIGAPVSSKMFLGEFRHDCGHRY